MDRYAKHRILARASVMIAGLCIGAGTADAQPPGAPIPQVTIPDRPDNTNVPRAPARLIGNIHWVGHSQVGAFLLKTSQGYILIDSTSAEHWPDWARVKLKSENFRRSRRGFRGITPGLPEPVGRVCFRKSDMVLPRSKLEPGASSRPLVTRTIMENATRERL